ncbi:methyltransferase domain-containing protein [Trichocoleus sp. FACHB-90]|uniref:class I SAM-dependent methyltransferase n=1 Tax=Cyanophyceae TaxID=3028117 RepID=UPI0016871059|nr:class I SAM-dependent methyltransferase [Trichocoleus sp. FACHB-90]MBD1929769.1 methyltransferase domain-containing protein [Trichocoleus sp. FACHB-90]
MSRQDSQTTFQNQWNAELYDRKHSFVSQLGSDVVEMLSPKHGESILDLGCGTGHLSEKITTFGAKVVGIDSAATMIEQARKNYPALQFEVIDATNLQFTEQFDAVFSNAALHWIKEPEKVVSGIYQALKPKGRFVAEFGGKGNVKAIVTALYNALQAAGYPVEEALNPWYFPSIGEYGALLEKHSLELTFATLFDRPTPLDDGEQGVQNWIKMFANNILTAFPAEQQMSIIADIEKQLRPTLYKNGTWFADYRRIRVIAIKN